MLLKSPEGKVPPRQAEPPIDDNEKFPPRNAGSPPQESNEKAAARFPAKRRL